MITEAQISKALREIEKNLLSGDSIQVARRKACRNDTSKFANAVMATESYLILLNYYESTRPHGNTFIRCPVTKKIKPVRKKK